MVLSLGAKMRCRPWANLPTEVPNQILLRILGLVAVDGLGREPGVPPTVKLEKELKMWEVKHRLRNIREKERSARAERVAARKKRG